MAQKKFKQVCGCKHCGNEAEMEITCTLAEEKTGDAGPEPHVVPREEGKTPGHAVCSHCGGEADIWLDI